MSARSSARRVLLLIASLALVLPLLVPATSPAAAQDDGQASQESNASAFGFVFVKRADQATCSVAGGLIVSHFERGECGYVDFRLTGADGDATVAVNFIGPDGGEPFSTSDASHVEGNQWSANFTTGASWPAGQITAQVVVEGAEHPAGTQTFGHNQLFADVNVEEKEEGEPYRPGEDIPVTGNVHEVFDAGAGSETQGVAASFSLQLVTPDGEVRDVPGGPFTAGTQGDFSVSVPGDLTADIQLGPETDFTSSVSVEVVEASYSDPVTGAWAAVRAGAGGTELFSPPDTLLLDNSFVSSTGWVRPGETYPFRVFVRNFTDQAATDIEVTVPPPASATFEDVTTLTASGSASIGSDGAITWTIDELAAAQDGVPQVATLVVEGRAASLTEDPEIVWKDLSSTATLGYAELTGDPLTSASHGPKVIPPHGLETARYGDKPFPIVPAAYRDRKYQPGHSGQDLERVVNDPNFAGSTFNLYQEMSYGQLFPEGRVPSLGIQTADFDYEPGFDFSTPETGGPCRGTTAASVGSSAYGSPAYPERIVDGVYQLPGDTEYYGGDDPSTATVVGAALVGASGGSIDSACGPLGKAVFDAAQAADPEIDYNNFDSDKDGVVDFFMLEFVGCGGNGASQIPALCPYDEEPYDNIWPHSSSLEMQFRDQETGLRGYISDDQLVNLKGVPQCWIDDSYTTSDDCAASGGSGNDDLPVHIRVGPYNVNPETSIDSASVISHEYGHHLGLPDFYSGYSAYADMNLMAADYSQHMTIFAKQDLGWVVPNYLSPGQETTVADWSEIKSDTGEISWQTPGGEPYTLSADNGDQNIHNGQAYGLKLPKRQLIDPTKVTEQASPPHLWYSGRGNDFGCPPGRGHNLDVYLPELSDVEEGTTVTLEFKSSWDIEWDWDYGFVFTTPDGENYTSQPSDNGYTTSNEFNPNNQQCFSEHNNGLTGTSGSYQDGTETADRNPASPDYSKGSPFLTDTYDVSELAGTDTPVIRFSYFTDAAFDRPGWFIDDIEVTAGDEVIYESNFEEGRERGRIFPGGCGGQDAGFKVAAVCTAAWNRVNAETGDPSDHAYYLELRDQAGFDFNGHNQSERGDTSWEPGVLLEYTDENHGYGNNGVPQPPAQHYLDSQPSPGSDCGSETGGNCSDASFTAAEGDSHFDDIPDDDNGIWVDNFSDPSSDSGNWEFGYDCLSMDVTSMSGNSNNTAALPADLTAGATLTAHQGCVPFGYGVDPGPIGLAEACGAKVPPAPFDDIRGDLHRDAIACISWYTITVGQGDIDGDGSPEYAPTERISRAQMASFLVRLATETGLNVPASPGDAFPDDGDSVHHDAINALAELDIVQGREDGTYAPGAPVSRDQMASFIANLHKKATGSLPQEPENAFTDDDGDTHEANINALAALGVVKGIGDGRYAPSQKVARDQMASFMSRDLVLLVEDDIAHPGGARVTVDSAEVGAGDKVAGTLQTNKQLQSVSVTGCGADIKDLAVADDGAFEVAVPGDQEAGFCAMTFAATTSRGGDAPAQAVEHAVRVQVTD